MQSHNAPAAAAILTPPAARQPHRSLRQLAAQEGVQLRVPLEQVGRRQRCLAL